MKGQPWSAGLPVVTVAQSATPKPITLVMPFYMNADFLRRQVGWWGTYPVTTRTCLSGVIVDDGSPVPAETVLRDRPQPFPLRLFRLGVDCRWNWLAARNIGAHVAADGWLLLTDMDHVVPASTCEALIYGKHDPSIVYGFSRIEHTGETVAPHPNSWFMTKATFWKIGGYDEALSGHYGTDGEYRRRLAGIVPLMILRDRLIRHEHVGDSSTTAYLRKQPEDAAVKQIVAARGKDWHPKTLSFPYAEVGLC